MRVDKRHYKRGGCILKSAFNLFGRVVIKLKGLNVEKFLNLLVNSKFRLFDVKRESYNCFVITIESKYLKEIIKQIKIYNYQYEIVKTYGLYTFYTFCIKRFWLVFSVLACVGVYIFSNQFLWKINISGNKNIPTPTIIKLLNDNSIAIGKPKRNISVAKVEDILQKSLDGLAMTSVYIYGNSLNINISEKVQQQNVKYECIKSEYNGVVKTFELISGTPTCKSGDIVREGDILVYPYIIDSSGNKKSIKAQANIVIEVDFNLTIEYNKNREMYEDTGNQYVTVNTSLFGLKFNKDKVCPYKSYRKVIMTSCLFDNLFLPIKKIKTIYYEQAKTTKEIPFEEVSHSIIAEAYSQGQQKLMGHKIIEKNHSVTKVGEIYYVTAMFRAVVGIGGKV